MRKQLLILSIGILSILPMMAQNVGINESGNAPNSNAMLDINADSNHDKGLLIPRLTTAQRTGMSLAAADEGITVYDTNTHSYWYWDGSNWVWIGQKRYWSLTGNAGTTAGTNFLGTTDAVDLVFKTNAAEIMRITSDGNIGVGVTSPTHPIEVNRSNDDWGEGVLYVTNTKTTNDAPAISGYHDVTDYWGYGGYFKGGYVGVEAVVYPSNDDYYYGVISDVWGGSGENEGIYDYVSGSGTNYGLKAFVYSGDNNYGVYVTCDDGSGSDLGVYGEVSGTGDHGIYGYNSTTSTTQDYTTSGVYGESDYDVDGVSGGTVYNAAIMGWDEPPDDHDGIGVWGYCWPDDGWGYGAWTQGGYYGIRAEGSSGNYYKSSNISYSGGILAQGMVGVNAIGSKIGLATVSDNLGLLCMGNKDNNDPAAFFDGNIIRNGYDAMLIHNDEDNTNIPAYTMVSNTVNIQTVGQGTLHNGHVVINFDNNFSSVVSSSDPIIVIVTPTAPNTGNIVVTNTDVNGFEVNSNISSNGTFNWIAIGKIQGYNTSQQTAVKSKYLDKDYINNEAQKLYPASKDFPQFKSNEFFTTTKVKNKPATSHNEEMDPKLKKVIHQIKPLKK